MPVETMRTRRFLYLLIVLTVVNLSITYVWVSLIHSTKTDDNYTLRALTGDDDIAEERNDNNMKGNERHVAGFGEKQVERNDERRAERLINETLNGIDGVKLLLKEHHSEHQAAIQKILRLQEAKQQKLGVVDSRQAPVIVPANNMEMGQDQKSGDNNTKTEHVNVLVMASMRTGSSFVGELFKQNPEFLYIFEPLRALKLHDNDAMLPVLGIEMLRDMYKCNFTTKTTKNFLMNLYNPRVKSGKRDIVRVWVDELERGGATCDYGDGTCFKMSPPRASNSCSGFKYRGIKTIRIQDLNLVVYLMNLADIKLKVINVLRDPRAMMASAIPLHLSKYQKASRSATQYTLTTEHWDDDLDHRLNVYCTSMMRNFLLGTKGTWMPKSQYVPLRYEDMAAAPYDVARKVYDFLGLKLPEIVTKWLEKNTVADLKNDHALYAYKTKRNSTAAAQGWRGRMTFDLAKKIENTGDCGRFMDLLGYRKVIDQGMLQNISVSLLV